MSEEELEVVVLISCNDSHCHAEVDFRDWYESREVRLTDDLINSEKSFVMSYEGISKNGCQILAYGNQRVP